MIPKGGGLVLELYPSFGPEFYLLVVQVFRLAIGKSLLYGLDIESELAADHAEQEHHTLFVDWGVSQPAEVYWFAVEMARSFRLAVWGQ